MYLRNRILPETSYLNIKDHKNNNILLNYINKNFYIKYIKKSPNEFFFVKKPVIYYKNEFG
jgi:hypothetical protein